MKVFVLTMVNDACGEVVKVSVHKTFQSAYAEMEKQYNAELDEYHNEMEEFPFSAIEKKGAFVVYSTGGEDGDEAYLWQIDEAKLEE